MPFRHPPLPFHCLSLTSHFPLPFLDLPLPFHCLQVHELLVAAEAFGSTDRYGGFVKTVHVRPPGPPHLSTTSLGALHEPVQKLTCSFGGEPSPAR